MSQDSLLKLLEGNARLTDEDLAGLLGETPEAVTNMRMTLEKQAKIVGYQAIIHEDESAGVAAFIEVRVTPERMGGFDRLAERIARFPEVQACYLASGGFDLLVLVEAKTLVDVARFVSEKLSSMDNILSTSTHFRLKTYKKNGLLFETPVDTDRLVIAP